MNNVFQKFVAHLKTDKSAIAKRVYNQVYQRDILNGIFADGNGYGYIERCNGRLPRYAHRYIMRFIAQYQR